MILALVIGFSIIGLAMYVGFIVGRTQAVNEIEEKEAHKEVLK